MRDDSDAPQPAGFVFPTVPVQIEQGSLTPTSLGIVATLDGATIEVVVELLDGAVHVLGYTPADDEPAFSIHLTPGGARAEAKGES
jgi:hypothetical protein